MDVNKAEEGVISGDTGILLGPWWMSESVVNLCTQKNPEARWSMAAIPSNGDGKAIVPRRSISAYFVVNADCEHPEALIKLMNMVATGSVDQEEWTKPQNGYVWNWCPTLYTDPYDIERVYEHFTDAMEADPEAEGEAPADFTETEKTYWEAMPAYNAFWENGDTTILEDEVAFMSFGNILARIDHNGGWATAIKVADSGDLMYNEYYGPATDTQKEVSATLTKLMNENYLKIIMGEQSIDTFDKFTEDWMALGGEDITKEVNEWYQENK